MEAVKITQLEAENIKRIKAVRITPTENGLTVIGGRNNQGKTSVLDAIIWELGGDRYRPSNAQRDGSVLPPKIRLTLSNGIVVERSGKNGDLKVTDSTGRKAGQQLLNSFVEQFALDMPKFIRAGSREKAATLLRIIGLEDQVNQLERRESDLYNQRRAVGQIADQKKKYADELPGYPDAPSEPVSAYDLIQEQQAILARNGENQRKRERLNEITFEKHRIYDEIQRLEEQAADLAKRIQERKNAYEQTARDEATAQKDALDLMDESTEELETNLRNIEAVNAKVRVNQAKAAAEADAKEYSDQYEGLTAQIEDVRKQKRELLDNANLPLPGLSVENGELTYMGKAWDCMSGSDQLRVSAAIVRALNPKCGFILIDKLEQMDLETLREFGDWIASQGLQGIATRVSTGDECSIIIEDGYAKNTDETPVPTAPVKRTWNAGTF